MIGYYSYAIVALLLNYIHSTNAASTFHDDRALIESHLRDERTFFRSLDKKLIRNLSFGKRTNIVCDVLDQREKDFLCEKITRRMIEYYYGNVFVTFVEPDDNPPQVPQLVDENNPHRCKRIAIKDVGVGMAKRMFWCKSRLYIKGGTVAPLHHHMPGFFCAGSQETKGRVFMFRTAEPTDRSVIAVGEMDDVALIIGKVDGVPVVDDDSTATSPASSASSELF